MRRKNSILNGRLKRIISRCAFWLYIDEIVCAFSFVENSFGFYFSKEIDDTVYHKIDKFIVNRWKSGSFNNSGLLV